MAYQGGMVPASLAPRVDFAMAWIDCEQPAPLDTITLDSSVFSVLNAADEVQAELNALASKINELITLIETMRPTE